ncbi:ABC-type dipeptide/oligopeptide/nickel transport system ATPase component [Aminobacter lissarensis]|uniref:ABC-type dipeptide/oligopeptide/nickel transport system ATPase component n=1 Tax=Aminobacter carboxidus TaxID=376165 RepID=A0A8E2BDB5_9HYPH|nr:ABC transporter ATP-binding protein [Aminobacter lissarensis]MBB6467109.1 ABC-type dipeptide/oligopeptide/nickel transport system ATPase component [Aminobacter lissarensis]
MTASALLSVRDLTVDYPSRHGPVRAVNGVSFSVAPGSVLGVVGESGSGKSSIGYALMGLTDASRATLGGAVNFEGRHLLGLSRRDWRKLRGNRIAMVFQDAMATLNPVMRVGDQIGEVFRFHRPDMSRKAIRAASLDLLERVGIQEASRRIDAYPHQLSGGMRQRVVIAAAIALKPALLIADEPTTALDVTVQAQILHLMQELSREQGMAMILVSHDLDVVGDVCEDVVVMKDGVIVEAGHVDDVLSRPRHAYTLQLLNARPSFGAGHMHGEVSHG